MAFSLYYRKTNNDELFQALEKSDFEIRDLQNYVPLYDNFFSLNSTNYNSINLNQKYYLHSVTKVQDRNSLFAQVIDCPGGLKIMTIHGGLQFHLSLKELQKK